MATSGATGYPAAPEGLEVDVAVVGGGIAGLCTAWELSRTGRSVAVLEAGRIAAAVTGHTTAKVSALHTMVYSKLRGSLGREAARSYALSQSAAVEHVVATAAELGIECELERQPSFTYMESQDRFEELRAEAEAAAEAGLPATLVWRTDLPFPVAGAVRVDNQAQFHPRRYLLGLTDDLVARGGQVFENTRVLDLHEGEPHRLVLEGGGEVTARYVVIATHYPILDRAMLFPRLEPHRELVVAAPLPPSADPGGMYITPEDGTRSVRTAPFGSERLLIITGASFRPGAADVSDRFTGLAEWATERFGVEKFAYHWAAQDTSTPDQVPYIGRLHPRTDTVFVATGFNGWGMSNGVLAGSLITRLIEGDPPAWAELYDPVRLHARTDVPGMVKAGMTMAGHFVGDRLRRSGVDDPMRLAPGSGAVMRIGGHRVAVHRDADGLVHAVSATCTHMGCVVAFNDAERTWDCPCHGSRFAPDGTVLNGPATRPLERRPLTTD
ncbi:MAG TPA: FAD-dependent oxidoreductase [Pseudonocardiaceae bacterium]